MALSVFRDLTSFLCETKGGEMYFVQSLNFMWHTI